jgi:uncharacterized protein (TIGR01777 family)
MRIIISGGSGFIGRALTEDLVKDSHEVEIISRRPDAHKHLPGGVTAFSWGEGALIEHLAGADAIVHLAGASLAGENPLRMRWTAKRKKQILESRLRSGEMISEAIKSVGEKPKVLIQSSAVGYYGPLGDEIVDETFPNGDDFLAGVCRAWEASTQLVEAIGVRRVVIRTGLVLSPEGGIFPLFKLPFSMFIGGRIGSGEQYLSWIHLDDIVKGIRFLIDHQQMRGVYNMTSPGPLQNAEFVRRLGKAMRRPAFVPVPAFVLKLALGETSTLALDGQRVVPKRLVEAGYNFKYETFEDALPSLLGHLRPG